MEKTYYEKLEEYKEEDYFCKCTIVINYVNNAFLTRFGKRKYIVTSVELNEMDNDFKASLNELNGAEVDVKNQSRELRKPVVDLSESIKDLVDRCNTEVLKARHKKGWQIFYVYKELLQTLTGKDLKFNYFRGQSCDKPLLPGIMRLGVDKDYIYHFDSIYKKLAYEFPDKLNYISMDKYNIDERESNLSLLQHYGLKTALLDITRNPYIAMLFMLEENIKENDNPTLYLFRIDDYSFDKEHPNLFTEVKKSQINERIMAQKGAFLNFEKALISDVKLEKIPYVKIVLNYDIDEYNRLLDLEIKSMQKLSGYEVGGEDNLFTFLLKNEKSGIDNSKKLIKKYINNELDIKLKEIFYTKEDMFPDFENRIRYLSNMYKKTEEKVFSFSPIKTEDNDKTDN